MIKTIKREEAETLIQEYLEKPQEEQRALCCLLGAIAGDNLGNYNEFSHSITEEELDEAMNMTGVGVHSLLPGQSTDDTELATSMAYGLIDNSDPNVFDCNLISKYYTLWFQSSPFDIAMTIEHAFSVNGNIDVGFDSTQEECQKALMAQRNRYSTSQGNRHSQSNSGCMRLSPLCVFLSKQTDQNLIRRIVITEQNLTHYCQPAIEAAYVYARLVINLIRGATAQEVYEDLSNYFSNECNEEEVKEWWNQKQKNPQFDNAVISMGQIKHGLTQCFVVLKRLADEEKDESFKKSEVYERIIREIIQLCGDSDTNCTIVGGMLGAYLNLKEFPQKYLQKIIECDISDQTNNQIQNPRHEIYNPRNSMYLCNELLKKAKFDTNIKIIDEYLTEDLSRQIQKQIQQEEKNEVIQEEQGNENKDDNIEQNKPGSLVSMYQQFKAEQLSDDKETNNNQQQMEVEDPNNNQNQQQLHVIQEQDSNKESIQQYNQQ